MKFENRKLYSHGQNKGIFLLQIPKVISNDMGLTKDSILTIEYKDDKFIVTKDEKQCQETN